MTGGRRVYDLEQPRFAGMPVHASHQPGYSYFLHRRHGDGYAPEETGPRTSASGIIVAMEHSGTHGIYIVENLYLEELAAAGEHRTLFICTPLKLSGATGSPVRPIAIASGDLPAGS